MVSNIYLKFSELAVLDKYDKPFSNTYVVTSATVLTEFLSLDEIVYTPVEELVEFVKNKGKNGFSNPYQTVKLLQMVARDSYHLDQVLYEPLNVAIASSFNAIKTLKNKMKIVDKAIEKTIRDLNTTEYQSPVSVPGIGPMLASGVLAKIGSISAFDSHNALAKYAGLT